MAHIDEVDIAVGKAKALQEQVSADSDALCRAILRGDVQATPTPLRELVSLRAPDVAVQADETYHFAGVYCLRKVCTTAIQR